MPKKCNKCDGSGVVNTRYADGTPSREMADCPDCTPDLHASLPDLERAEKVPPPDGYPTWLDCAVATTEFASVRFYTRVMTTADMRAAVRAELAALRAHVNDRVDQAWNNGYKTGEGIGYQEAKEKYDV